MTSSLPLCSSSARYLAQPDPRPSTLDLNHGPDRSPDRSPTHAVVLTARSSALPAQIAASEGGATPIIPSHAVVEHLEKASPDVAERLRTLGVRYVRTLPKDDDPSSPIGKSWQKSFEAETREEAEAVRAPPEPAPESEPESRGSTRR